MLISMTGFGRSVRDASFGRLVVEIQSVNRKYLEIFVSVPKELNRFELEIRKTVGEKISRGQVSVRLFLTPSEEALAKQLPDPVVLKRLKETWVKLAKASGCDEKSIDLPFLLQHLPTASQSDLAGSEEEILSAIREYLLHALDAMVDMKKKEGHSLSEDISQRLNEMEKMVRAIETHSPESVAKQREKLKEKIAEVLEPSAELDERLFREIAFFAERVDIAEEITRLASHISQFRENLKTKGGQVGRKLDFLVQEMGREINTIGSKSSHAAISRLVVDCKSELEKIREQIQNVE